MPGTTFKFLVLCFLLCQSILAKGDNADKSINLDEDDQDDFFTEDFDDEEFEQPENNKVNSKKQDDADDFSEFDEDEEKVILLRKQSRLEFVFTNL